MSTKNTMTNHQQPDNPSGTTDAPLTTIPDLATGEFVEIALTWPSERARVARVTTVAETHIECEHPRGEYTIQVFEPTDAVDPCDGDSFVGIRWPSRAAPRPVAAIRTGDAIEAPTVQACPDCGETRIQPRPGGVHEHPGREGTAAWRCRECGETFAEPCERPSFNPSPQPTSGLAAELADPEFTPDIGGAD